MTTANQLVTDTGHVIQEHRPRTAYTSVVMNPPEPLVSRCDKTPLSQGLASRADSGDTATGLIADQPAQNVGHVRGVDAATVAGDTQVGSHAASPESPATALALAAWPCRCRSAISSDSRFAANRASSSSASDGHGRRDVPLSLDCVSRAARP